MITVIKILFAAMILAALYGLLLCVAIPLMLWRARGKLWEESSEESKGDCK